MGRVKSWVRLADSAQDDQKRVVTPQQAKQDGVDYMVIGRPITKAAQPSQQLLNIYQSIQ